MTRTLRPAAIVTLIAIVVMSFAVLVPRAFSNDYANTVEGIDVSNHNHPGGVAIDWKTVSATQGFAIVKATESTGFVNPSYAQDVESARANGLEVGAYHFARPGIDARAQARHFANVIKSGPANTLPPVLDLEVDEGLSAAQLQQWTRDFMDELKKLTGRTPILYTYKYFWIGKMANTTEFAEFPLWLAAYQTSPPAPVGGWDRVDIWQRSGSGRVAGVPTIVDMNLFNGDKNQLKAFAAGNNEAAGGQFAQLRTQTAPNSAIEEGLAVLEKDNTALVGAILGLATGVLSAPQVAELAKAFGFSDYDAANIAEDVTKLLASGKLPIDDLNNMLIGKYSVGDLLILLHNSTKDGEGSSE
ncbi:glycoside hydrolase family 25 protein [Corynebacterium aquatimens]|uniref:GH25 family lysozyme M1 (1,4-beta-N-acetylmuramidase) n=1 Tax=Corynebacterium aquatimens TaxID=1190508 RepID=A0A931GRV0_9CORY|nr:glycoside hydrolase family 25 protein [Corynebacterium aquatimens]MBG6121392.1 GH25 family lysozyme M1 (1,4-beta-N-acetylmuramidase) [Corynebacterium aquatimens]